MWSYSETGNLTNVLHLAWNELRALSAGEPSNAASLTLALGLVAGAEAWRSGDYEGSGEQSLTALEVAFANLDARLPPVRRARLYLAYGDVANQIAAMSGGVVQSAPIFKAGIDAIAPADAPNLWAELQFKYASALPIDSEQDGDEIVVTCRAGLAVLQHSSNEIRLRALLLRRIREVLTKLERIPEMLDAFNEEQVLLGTSPDYFHARVDALISMAWNLRDIGERHRSRKWIERAIDTYRAVRLSLDEATVEQKHTPDWLSASRMTNGGQERAEEALRAL
jgi:hypothetical protein